MKLGEFLKQTLIKGAPAGAALALGSPELAAVLAAASASADGIKHVGKAIEDKTGWRPHKVASPAVAVGVGAVAAAAIDPAMPEKICAILNQVCAQPALLATIPGIAMILWQVLSSNLFKVTPGAES